jgi:hypothetical protein
VSEPIYSQSKPNEPIDLGSVVVQFDHNGTPHRETAHVTMTFVPEKRLELTIPVESGRPSPALGSFALTLPDRNVTIKALCLGVHRERGGTFLVPEREPVTVTPPATAVSTAAVHLLSFPEFWAPEGYDPSTGEPPDYSRRCHSVVLKAGGWNITISATDQAHDLEEALRAQGGYVITHMAAVKRDDGATFSSEQLADILSCLHYFLSFVLGRWVGMAMPVGFDSDGNRVFEEWGMRWSAGGAWNASSSWFDEMNGELLAQVFPGFVSLWKNPIWGGTLTSAIYWYLGGCGGVGIGVDAGLILAQTALELLAWTHCVEDRKMVSAAAFKPRGLSAADKLRLLATSLSIPKEIPPTQPALHGMPGKKWVDGMEAITVIRNAKVHPGLPTEPSGRAYFEAYELSLWLIELTLLHLCGHNGKYANRLRQRWRGEVDLVPWAEKVAGR